MHFFDFLLIFQTLLNSPATYLQSGKVAHNHLSLNTLPKPPAPLLRQELPATNYKSTT